MVEQNRHIVVYAGCGQIRWYSRGVVAVLELSIYRIDNTSNEEE